MMQILSADCSAEQFDVVLRMETNPTPYFALSVSGGRVDSCCKKKSALAAVTTKTHPFDDILAYGRC